MAVICPTVTAYDERSYDYQLENVASFVERIHLDFMDGDFTPKKSPDLSYAKWPVGVVADIHLMYRQPLEVLDYIIAIKPKLLITHAEAQGNFFDLADNLKAHEIKVGVALLRETPVSVIEPALEALDHVLVFSGALGRFGGQVDLDLLDKVQQLRQLKPQLEIGWDGGVNEHNARHLAAAGVDVLNVGGAIQRADNPTAAYARLKALVEGHNDS